MMEAIASHTIAQVSLIKSELDAITSLQTWNQ